MIRTFIFQANCASGEGATGRERLTPKRNAVMGVSGRLPSGTVLPRPVHVQPGWVRYAAQTVRRLRTQFRSLRLAGSSPRRACTSGCWRTPVPRGKAARMGRRAFLQVGS